VSTGAAGAPSPTVYYYPNDYGFNLNERFLTAAYYPGHTFSGVKASSVTFYTNYPTVGFNEGVTLAAVVNPSGFLVISDAKRPDNAIGRGHLAPQYADPTTGKGVSFDPSVWTANAGQAAVAPRHQGGTNAGYADGHVKYRKVTQLWRSITDNDFRYDSTGS
jgi:prepilin-type processing-associated H-X9-DG protein